MSDKKVLSIEITSEQESQLESRASERGFTSLADYLLALVEADMSEVEPDDERIDAVESFKQGWHEAMTDQVITLDQMWAMLEDEDDE
jgi:hypothetical protein